MELIEYLTRYGYSGRDDVQEITVPNCILSRSALRDGLCLLGEILLEDPDSVVYVASVRAGLWGMNRAVVAVALGNGTLTAAGYAREGFIPQNTCAQALEQLRSMAEGTPVPVTSGLRRRLPCLLALVCVVGALAAFRILLTQPDNSAFLAEVEQTIAATQQYNAAVERFNLRVSEYNQAVQRTSIDNLTGLPDALEPLALQSESVEENTAIVSAGVNNREKITADTQTVRTMTEQVEQALAVVGQITAPQRDWVLERLATVESVTGAQAVTEDFDPTGLLGKEGGLSACVYFTVTHIDPDTVPGAGIPAKGTDAGGAVEVYPTLEDALARCSYLSEFDGTVLYSGSYAIVGTMVIRTSYRLTDTQQLELTAAVARALTALT